MTELFSGTSDFYRAHRPGIPVEVAALLDRHAPANAPRRLLDIGTGTGLVVKSLIDRFDDVIAIDPDENMISAARAELDPLLHVGSWLRFQQCTAENFSAPVDWRADLVTICRAFHWLDQPRVLAQLEAQVAPEGVVAVFGDKSLWRTSSPWKDAVRAVVQEFLGVERRAGERRYTNHDLPYSEVLRASAFDLVTEATVPVRRTWTVDGIVGYLYSTSFAAPRLFEDRLEEFELQVRKTLAGLSPSGIFTEDNEFHLCLARRSRT